MTGYSCPDCEADLVSVIRALDLEEGETAFLVDDGRRIIISKISCSNGCSGEQAPPRPGICNYPGCDLPATRKRGRSPLPVRCAEHSKLKVEAGK